MRNKTHIIEIMRNVDKYVRIYTVDIKFERVTM